MMSRILKVDIQPNRCRWKRKGCTTNVEVYLTETTLYMKRRKWLVCHECGKSGEGGGDFYKDGVYISHILDCMLGLIIELMVVR